MSEKKEVKKAAAVPVEKKSKVTREEKTKRDGAGKKIMKVARGSARAVRRAGLAKDWRKTTGAKQMLPAANDKAVEVAA